MTEVKRARKIQVVRKFMPGYVLAKLTLTEAKATPKTQVSVDYEIGDQVKVLEGPFASFNGVVPRLSTIA